ncbi:MAG: asparagine synthetase B family protein [Longimicrobiales bacterium]
MCGIAGYAALDPRRPLDSGPVLAMLRCIAHRGPDDEGVFESPGIVLGHRRLSIIDVEAGHQPLFGQDERTAIVCNGEIYNYRELARELSAKGHTFRTRSDTEVAAHAYDAWGTDFLDRLDGMFALALWDGARRRLVLARDRAGEKPLFWTVCDGLLLFASELSALLAHPALEPEIDPVSLSAYLANEYVPAPRSMLAGVHKLAPATALVLEDGVLDSHHYWRLDPRPSGWSQTPALHPPPPPPPPSPPLSALRTLSGLHPPSPPPSPTPPAPASRTLSAFTSRKYAESVRELRRRLEAAVTSRLVSDVPLGVFLSGGIDSSTVAALAAKAGALETFSIGFEEASFDESGWARQVAKAIGSHHHERIVRGGDVPELVPRLGALLDEPIGDASVLPTALLSAFARERVTVALGGDGGDELFAGYYMHQGQRVARIARAVPPVLRRAMDSAARRLPVSHQNFSFGFKVRSYLRGAGEPPPLNHALWMSSFSPAEQQALLEPDVFEAANGGRDAFAAVRAAWAESAGAPLLARVTHLDALTYLPNDILTKVDRAAMSVALEVRAPFLARDVLEFAFSVPDAYRMRGLSGKRMLRDAVRGLLPDAVIDRPKKGFGMPVAAWLNGPLAPLVDDLFAPDRLRAAGLFRAGTVQRMLADHRAGLADHRKPLWTLLVFELWRAHHLVAKRESVLSGAKA